MKSYVIHLNLADKNQNTLSSVILNIGKAMKKSTILYFVPVCTKSVTSELSL
jgi:hypothetical protein